jgi:hypothetical protein
MAFYSGLDGQLYLDGSKIGKVQNWSLNASQAVLETTSLEDTDRTLINGVRSMSGSCRVFYHSDGNASDFIDNIIKSGATGAEDGAPMAMPATSLTTSLSLVRPVPKMALPLNQPRSSLSCTSTPPSTSRFMRGLPESA